MGANAMQERGVKILESLISLPAGTGSRPRAEHRVRSGMDRSSSNRRVDVRLDVRVRVVAFGVPGASDQTTMETRDLSLGGMLCDSPTIVALGRPVRLRLDLPDADGVTHPVVLTALALRSDGEGPYLLAFHFVGVSDRIQHILRRFIASRMPPTR